MRHLVELPGDIWIDPDTVVCVRPEKEASLVVVHTDEGFAVPVTLRDEGDSMRSLVHDILKVLEGDE